MLARRIPSAAALIFSMIRIFLEIRIGKFGHLPTSKKRPRNQRSGVKHWKVLRMLIPSIVWPLFTVIWRTAMYDVLKSSRSNLSPNT